MTWRLRVVHRTAYSYDAPVQASYNEARMTPLSDAHQSTVSTELRTDPATRPFSYVDYWGTLVSAFDLHDRHDALVITATSVVETEPEEPPVAEADWARLASPEVTDRFAELLDPTRYTQPEPDLVEQAKTLADGLDPVETVLAVCGWTRQSLEYQPGVTGVHTSAMEALKAGRGVCQDYAHLAIALLRSLGVPTRYVSGYLHPVADAGRGVEVAGESHAWIEAWTGQWWGHDPTNDTGIGERHVIAARGRDYADVSPLRGIYAGRAASALDVRVTVTRLR